MSKKKQKPENLSFKKYAPLFLSLLAVWTAFLLSHFYFNFLYEKSVSALSGQHRVEAVVTKVNYTTLYSASYHIKILSLDGNAVLEGIFSPAGTLYTDYVSDIALGECFHMNVIIEDIRDINSDMFSFYRNLAGGIWFSAVSDDPDYILSGREGFSIPMFFQKLNAYFSNLFEIYLGKGNGKFTSALFLGNSEELNIQDKRDFRRLGISHILAVSGMHLSILIGGLEKAISKIRLHKIFRSILLVILILFYTALTGFSMSVLRSAAMLILCYAVDFSGERADSLERLFVSVAVICLISPAAICDISLLLSFFATMGLILIGNKFNTILRKNMAVTGKGLSAAAIRSLLSGIGASLGSVVFILPLAWLYFGEISLLSPFATLLFTPSTTAILYLAPLLLLSGLCNIPFLTPFFAKITEAFCEFTLDCVNFFAQNYNTVVSLRYPFVKYIALLFVLLALILLFNQKSIAKSLLLPFCVCTVVFSVCYFYYDSAGMNFYYLKSGLSNGFAVLSKNTSLICDISDGSQKLIRIGCNLFAENYTGELDTYVLTHYHKRHISTFSYFSRFTYISRLCLPEPQNETEQGILQTLCELAGQNGCQVYLYPKNQTAILETEEVTITIPEYSSLKRSSHPVVALTFDILDHKILYTSASAYESSLAGFAQTAAKEASVLIFGTHSPVFKKQIVLEEKNYPLLQLVIFDDAEMRYQVQNDFRFISRYADDPSTKLVLNR